MIRVYTVKKGDSLTGIASRFNVPYKALTIWNSIGSSTKIAPGDRLYIFADRPKSVDTSDKTVEPSP